MINNIALEWAEIQSKLASDEGNSEVSTAEAVLLILLLFAIIIVIVWVSKRWLQDIGKWFQNLTNLTKGQHEEKDNKKDEQE